MTNYKVSFFRLDSEMDKSGKEATKSEYVGSVTLSDINVSDNTSLIALAYRQATPGMQICNKVVVEKL